jgi:phosphoglucosamine mutase
MRVVLDCANGAAYKVAPLVLEELGAEVIVMGASPDGVNINHECGALHTEKMREAVVKYRADVGIALDGDADRVILCDERGQVVDGDQVLAILAQDLFTQGQLKGGGIVVTPMSNMGLEIALRKIGIKVHQAGVGDRAVVELMRKLGCNLGGEQSGHIVCLDKGPTGDGLVAALTVLGVLKRTGNLLSELRKIVVIVPQVLKNVRVGKKIPLEEIPDVKSAMDEAVHSLGDSGRLLVRYSGTEPLCRVMIEGEDEVLIKKLADNIASRISRVLA